MVVIELSLRPESSCHFVVALCHRKHVKRIISFNQNNLLYFLFVSVPPHQLILYDKSGRDVSGVVGPLEETNELVLVCEVRGGKNEFMSAHKFHCIVRNTVSLIQKHAYLLSIFSLKIFPYATL